jgi:hypothetical protein
MFSSSVSVCVCVCVCVREKEYRVYVVMWTSVLNDWWEKVGGEK